MLAAGAVALAGVGVVFWIVILVEIIAFDRLHPTLRVESDDVEACRGIRVSVIVPANNEGAHLDECLRSVLAQTFTRLELIVVDDRSTDDTLAIAQQVAADDPRVHVLRIDELPAGWTGKTHALARGAAVASGEWLLFTDADTVHHPGCLASALRYALRRPCALLSGSAALGTHTVLSALVDPMCAAVLASWYRRRGRGGPGRVAPFANGQFILIRADAYRALGGHQAVKAELLEDIALARRVDQQGGLVEIALLHDLVRVRMYGTFAESRRGWSRIFLEAARGNVRRMIRPAIILPAIALVGYLALVGAVVAGSTGTHGALWKVAGVLGAVEVAGMTLATGLVGRSTGVPLRYAIAAPVAAMLTGFFLGTAARHALTNEVIEWHGVAYPPTPRQARRSRSRSVPAFPYPHFMALAPLDVWMRLLLFPAVSIPARYWIRLSAALLTSAVATALTLPERLLFALWWRLRGQIVGDGAAPLFVIGYYRSGTTHLQYLLDCDPNSCSPKWVHTLAPQGFVFTWTLLRLVMIPLMPTRRPMDAMAFGPAAPSEDDFALNNWTLASTLPGRAVVPRVRRFYDRFHDLHDLTRAERDRWGRYQRAFVRKLSMLAGSRRLLLKTPSHTARIEALLELFPAAKFIHISRHPHAVVRSNMALARVLQRRYCLQDAPPPEETEQHLVCEYLATEQRYQETRSQIPPGRTTWRGGCGVTSPRSGLRILSPIRSARCGVRITSWILPSAPGSNDAWRLTSRRRETIPPTRTPNGPKRRCNVSPRSWRR